jgi:DNA-binding NarL/FixJ family response regulator
MATTVLIVDDHPSFRSSARTLLEDEGYAVVGEASTGAEALDAVEELHPELMLLDVQLPDLNGFEIASRLQGNGSPDIVLVSSRDAADFGTMVVECGALGFIPKAELSGEALQRLMK